MFEWLKNKLFGIDKVVFYNEPMVEIISLSKKPKKIVKKPIAKKAVAAKKQIVKKKPVVKAKK